MSKPSFIGVEKTLQDEFFIRGIKILDIGYISTIYLSFAFVTSIYIDKLFGELDPEKADEEDIYHLTLSVLVNFFILGVVAYVIRNIVEHIPFPLNNVYGYNHFKLKELTSGGAIMMMLFFFQTNLQNKLRYIAKRYKKFIL